MKIIKRSGSEVPFDMVEDQIMAQGRYTVARKYIIYRYVQSLKRHSNTTDDKILSLIECNNEEAKQENSNKNPTVNSVQRDYMAGEVSKDITMRLLLPPEVVRAHNEGIIHFHDSDYFAQHMHNCDRARGQRRPHRRSGGRPSARRDPPRRADHPVPGRHADDHQRSGSVRHRVHVPERGSFRG